MNGAEGLPSRPPAFPWDPFRIVDMLPLAPPIRAATARTMQCSGFGRWRSRVVRAQERALSPGGGSAPCEDAALPRSAGIKILVIETDEGYRRHLADRIRVEGYKVYEACREDEAERLIARKHIDVVLLGFAGDKQRGLALLRSIRLLQPCPEVILLTFADEHSLAASIEGMKLGAFDEILVPFNVDTLFKRIREAGERKERRGATDSGGGEGKGMAGERPAREAPKPAGKKRGT